MGDSSMPLYDLSSTLLCKGWRLSPRQLAGASLRGSITLLRTPWRGLRPLRPLLLPLTLLLRLQCVTTFTSSLGDSCLSAKVHVCVRLKFVIELRC